MVVSGSIGQRPLHCQKAQYNIPVAAEVRKRLSDREQVSHKTLSVLVAELELCGFVEVERKGRGRGRGVDFYISLTNSIERKVLLDALKDLVV